MKSEYMPVLFFDTETTGLSATKGDKVIEISIVNEFGETVLDTLVDPEREIPLAASKVHGITNAMVVGKPVWDEILPKIGRLIEGTRIVAYNARYDSSFFPKDFFEKSDLVCAMQTLKAHLGLKRVISLEKAARLAEHSWLGDAHRALADTLACRAVWKWIQDNPDPDIETLVARLEAEPKGAKLRDSKPGVARVRNRKSESRTRRHDYKRYATSSRADLPWAFWEKHMLKSLVRKSASNEYMADRMRRPIEQILEKIDVYGFSQESE